MAEPIIKIEDLNVIYFLGKSNEVHALKNINLEIFPGEFIIFFGPSGCGKSTLLYSLAGLETHIHGKILVNNRDISQFSQKEIEIFHRNEVGMIFQAYYLINSLSVANNVILPQIFLKGGKKERTKKAMELLSHFGVAAQSKKLPNELSGGQQQRVAICRSLMNDPAILLADEPVGNLDSSSSQDVLHLLSELNERQNKTIILVTHNPAHLSYAHRVFYIKDGAIIDIKVNKAINRDVIRSSVEEAKQNMSKDMELLFRTFTSLSPGQIGNLLIPFKAKQIVADALIGLTSEEIGRIEKKVENLLMHGIEDNNEIFNFLDINQEKGGMGLDKRTAHKLTADIKDVVKEIKSLEEKENRLRLNSTLGIEGEIMHIRHYLIDVFNINIKDFISLEIINNAIRNRLENKIDKKEFQKIISLPSKAGGAGIDKRTAKKVSKRLELLILGKYK